MKVLPTKGTKKQGKSILIFTDKCEICEDHIQNVRLGKCKGCNLQILNMNNNDPKVVLKMEKCKVMNHPTTIIDDIIKIVGKPNFYWMCGDEFYEKLKKDYPFTI